MNQQNESSGYIFLFTTTEQDLIQEQIDLINNNSDIQQVCPTPVMENLIQLVTAATGVSETEVWCYEDSKTQRVYFLNREQNLLINKTNSTICSQ